jgi:hypothetical protein
LIGAIGASDSQDGSEHFERDRKGITIRYAAQMCKSVLPTTTKMKEFANEYEAYSAAKRYVFPQKEGQ